MPHGRNYVYMLLLISLLVYGLELLVPWRKTQKRIRRDFWLDGFYMVFNFSLFSLLGFYAISQVADQAVNDLRQLLGLNSEPWVNVRTWPVWGQWLVMLVGRDFIHYWIHRLLHWSPLLWSFHKVHHSVQEMGFAAHFRFHWMEMVVYRVLEYIPLGLIGFGVQDFFLVHILSIVIGHMNHANVFLPIGPLKYIFNSPQMHLWHHAYDMPRKFGANYGLTLSTWDWLFGTVYWPEDDAHVRLGFDDVEQYPQGFWSQMWAPFAEDGLEQTGD